MSRRKATITQNSKPTLFSIHKPHQATVGHIYDWYSNLGYSEYDIEEDFVYNLSTGNKLTASLAIFQKGKPHIPNMIEYIADTISEDKETVLNKFRLWFQQLPMAHGAVWVKDELPYFYSNVSGEPVPVPIFEDSAVKGKIQSKRVVSSNFDLTATLLALHNYIYANEGYSSYEAFSEILKLLFIKMEDERRNNDLPNRGFLINDQEFRSAMSDDKNDKSNQFLSRINRLFSEARNNYPSVFNQSDSLNLKLSTIAFAVSILQGFDLAHSPSDIKGTAFQKIIGAAHRGQRGQFVTPQPIARLMVNFLHPQPDELVLDPACGTGGFLIETLQYIGQNNPKDIAESFCIRNLYGIEINQAVARAGMMQLTLFGGNPKNILCTDSLQSELPEEWGKTKKADVVLTNPPFGSQGKIFLRSILRQYDLGHKWVKNDNNWRRTDDILSAQVPDILFIEKCLQLLRDGGRMGIVLPNGDLENSSLGYVRQFIQNNADVLAVISLPQDTFTPHGTGIKTSVLFVQKHATAKPTRTSNIFFGLIKNIGYEGGKYSRPKYKVDQNGNILKNEQNEPILDEDITDISNAYQSFLKTGNIQSEANYFIRTTNENNDRLDPNFYLPEYIELLSDLQRNGAVPLRSIAQIVTKRSEILRHPDTRIRYIELSNVDPRYPEIISATEMAVYEMPSRAAYEVREGDIITAVSGNSTGTESHATAFVTKEYHGCICTNGFRVIHATHINPFYLLCYMKTPYFLKQVFQHRTGAAIPAISDTDLSNILVLLPPEDMQVSIAKETIRSFKLRSQALNILQSGVLNISLK
jgi:type I restriction enzyme M protein